MHPLLYILELNSGIAFSDGSVDLNCHKTEELTSPPTIKGILTPFLGVVCEFDPTDSQIFRQSRIQERKVIANW